MEEVRSVININSYIDDPEAKNHGQIISEIYMHLDKEKRNEYFYMNTLLNKLLCGIHSVNTTAAFSQMRIGHSVADFVMINGEGRAYEIKSDLDNFDRLQDQLRDYYRAFSKVSVLASIAFPKTLPCCQPDGAARRSANPALFQSRRRNRKYPRRNNPKVLPSALSQCFRPSLRQCIGRHPPQI